MDHADIAVIGAGVMGAATARALARSGARVVVLEQFRVGHTRGSSHGRSRIFRFSYPDPHYVAMAQEALPRWRELEADAEKTILLRTGGLDAGEVVDEHARALEQCGADFEVLDGARAAARFDHLRFGLDERVLFQPDAGIVLADAAVGALVATAVRAGADLREGVKALQLEPRDGGVRIETSAGHVDAAAAVVAAGSWARGLLATAGIALDVRATRETVAYFDFPDAIPPTFVDWGEPAVYSLSSPGLGLKAGEHIAGPVTDPDDDGAPDAGSLERLSAWVAQRWPGADARPHHAETCLYTNTHDSHFVLERHGPIVVGSPCSGHGFKFAPLIGERLAALAVG